MATLGGDVGTTVEPAELLRRSNRQLLEHGIRGGGHGELSPSPIAPGTAANAVPVANATIPLHAHSGTHHAQLYIGSPPQRQTLIVDTGSRAMAFPCATCTDCNDCCGTHASPYFDPSRSTTHIVSSCGSCLLEGISSCPLFVGGGSGGGRCTFSQKYTEGSAWTATEVEDMVWLGSSDVVESIETYLPALAVAYPFGCQTSSTGLFRKQYADGILGLSNHETSLVNAFYREGLIASNAFSLCFTREGGVLSLGGSLDPEAYHLDGNGGMKTTPLTKQHEHGYYSAEAIRLVVGGENHDDNGSDSGNHQRAIVVTDATTRPKLLRDMNSGKGCILDSGTTDSYFPSTLSRAVRVAVIDYARAAAADAGVNHTEDRDLDFFSHRLRENAYTYREFETLLPTITVVFANEVNLTIRPEHYMEHVPFDASTGAVVPWEGVRGLTNRLYFDEADGSVLGANAFFGYDILFDGGTPDGEGRIGIAPADCHAAAPPAAAET